MKHSRKSVAVTGNNFEEKKAPEMLLQYSGMHKEDWRLQTSIKWNCKITILGSFILVGAFSKLEGDYSSLTSVHTFRLLRVCMLGKCVSFWVVEHSEALGQWFMKPYGRGQKPLHPARTQRENPEYEQENPDAPCTTDPPMSAPSGVVTPNTKTGRGTDTSHADKIAGAKQ